MELTLESLAKRIEALEKQIAERPTVPPRKKDWRRVAGMFSDSDVMPQIDAEGRAIRDADRKDAISE